MQFVILFEFICTYRTEALGKRMLSILLYTISTEAIKSNHSSMNYEAILIAQAALPELIIAQSREY